MQKALLVLEDEMVFEGISFGAVGETYGETVFNTSMMGYQEILTDPSYKGQTVVMTYPLIGNYGINKEDFESDKIYVEGFVVKEYSECHSNWRAFENLDTFLKRHQIVSIQGIDTRALTKHLREKGCLKSVISTIDFNKERLIEKVKKNPGLSGRDLVKELEKKEKIVFSTPNFKFRVVVFDCGIKSNIIRKLQSIGCEVILVSSDTKADEVLSFSPDGILLSNGPGDPETVTYLIETVKNLIGKKPIFGICLGHQILGLALGGKTYKLKFGHHGGNQPVKNLLTGKIEITAQNHNFCVDLNTLGNQVELTHINLSDQTVEGMRHKNLPIFSVQYHPEASPGPHDSAYLFEEFAKMMGK
ncbi:MAG: glutamine-hydrolyzing carbamoyl-phosphate synthase small subunit [bacterium]